MKRCFLLVLLFIAIMAPAWAVSGAEEIAWIRYVGNINNIMFSHSGKYIGFFGDKIAGVIRVSDSTLLWKDSIFQPDPYVGLRTMDFSLNDSLFAYAMAFDKNLYIKYSATGATYSTANADSLVNEMHFIDSSRILMLTDTCLRIFDYRSATFVYTEPNYARPALSKAGKYKLISPRKKPYLVEKPILYRIYKDSVGTQKIVFTGEPYPEGITSSYYAFSKDDKLMVLIPYASTYPDGLPLYVYDLETLVCRKVMVPGITKSPKRVFVDADKTHLVIHGKRAEDTTLFYDHIIVSLDDGFIKNYYRIVNEVNQKYILYSINDASPDSLHYIGLYGESLALLNAVRITSGMPPKINTGGDIKVFPNPAEATGQIITIDGIESAKSIIISDIFGRESFRSEFIHSSGNSGISFELPSLQKGVYFISIIDGEGRKIAKKLMVGE